MSAPIPTRSIRTHSEQNLAAWLPALVAVGKSPPPPPTIDRPPTPLTGIPEAEEPSPEQLQRMMDHWQKKIFEDTMRRKQEEAKEKMFARVKGKEG